MLETSRWNGPLSFLNEINGDRAFAYRTSRVLKTAFEDNVWVLEFGKYGRSKIDFNVVLEDGSTLTHSKNEKLLDIFKCWICIQTHTDITHGVVYKDGTTQHAINNVLTLIDYFLLNAEHFKLAQFGLSNITENDLLVLMGHLASKNEISESIYCWSSKLNIFLRTEIEKHDRDFLHQVILRNPLLSRDIPDYQDHLLNLSDDEIILSRAMLWVGGFYKVSGKRTSKNHAYQLIPNFELITKILYSQTLKGINSKPVPIELLLSPFSSYSKEYPSVPVRSSEEIFQEKKWMAFRSTISSLGYLKELFPELPAEILEPIAQLSKHTFPLSTHKRFKTVPPKIILEALRFALEFILQYGEEILESTLSVIAHAKTSKTKSLSSVENLDALLTPKIRNMGVKVWNLRVQMKLVERTAFKPKQSKSSENYFHRLRSNEGLYELNRILFGAIQLCIGTLMARRQAELSDLISGQCLNADKTHLIFPNRKTGFMEQRLQESRPLPPIAVRLIELLQRFHNQLAAIFGTNQKVNLFSYPDQHNGFPVRTSPTQFNNNLNIFCDYAQVERNDTGQRYYFRQHQLRRFFAMTFFWANSFGGMDTLRWFLGHTDIEHLYHYITESTPGNVLRASKASYGTEIIKSHSVEQSELADVIEKRFGTRNFKVLDSEELSEFIEDLLLEGTLEIEPIFFDGPEGKLYRIAIKLKPLNS